MFNKLDKIIRTIMFLLFNIIIQVKCNSEVNIKLMKNNQDLDKYVYKHLASSSDDARGSGAATTMANLRHQKHYQLQNSHHVHNSNKNSIKTLYQTGVSNFKVPLLANF